MDFVHDPPAEYIQQLTISTVFQGDASTILKKIPAQVFRCCISSPPYWGLRDYSAAQQIGAEEEPADYIQRLVAVFEEVRRVLRDDGTLWLSVCQRGASAVRLNDFLDFQHNLAKVLIVPHILVRFGCLSERENSIDNGLDFPGRQQR